MIDRVLVIFLDGVGLGDDDPQVNPLAEAPLPALRSLLGGHRPIRAHGGLSTDQASLVALDAQMGIPGLPQSGTGQVTLLTGVNAPALLGQHYGPYPSQPLVDLLSRDNLFKRILSAGEAVAFANAYSDRFLNRVDRGTGRLSANARAALLAGLKLRGPNDLKKGRAVSSLLTNEYFQGLGYDVPDMSAAEAGAQLAHLAHDHKLTFFEFWYSDVAGHRQDRQLSLHLLKLLDEFIGSTVEELDTSRALLLIVSDHGSFEDLRTRKHTLNPALTLVAGAGHRKMASRLRSLVDVTPALLDVLDEQ